MLFEVTLALLIGVIGGIITGITPGIHINTITALLIASLGAFSGVPPLALVVFVVALAVTHTIIDFIPSILTGAPDEESFLSVLPGHEMLQQGRGREAVLMTLLGSFTAIPILIIVTPVFVYAIPRVFDAIYRFR